MPDMDSGGGSRDGFRAERWSSEPEAAEEAPSEGRRVSSARARPPDPDDGKAHMGTLTYDSTSRVHFDDRTLAHLERVISTKLRRGESFSLSWSIGPEDGSGRAAVWIHPAIPLMYQYEDSRRPPLNPAWLEAMMTAADSARGLTAVPEPVPDENVS